MSDLATELRVIRICVTALTALPRDGRRRVTDYLSSRYHDPTAMPDTVVPLTRNPINGRFEPKEADHA